METNLFDIFAQFSPTETATKCEPITAGLINHTYAVFVENEEKPKYVLQKINTNIFKDSDGLIEKLHARPIVIGNESEPNACRLHIRKPGLDCLIGLGLLIRRKRIVNIHDQHVNAALLQVIRGQLAV